MDYKTFTTQINISEGAFGRLESFQELLQKWQRRMNLIAPGTVGEIWSRHILDSAQLLKYIPTERATTIADIGSGAGFPGMVLAICMKDRGAGRVTLIESDRKKCEFLKEAARVTDVDIDIHNARAEDMASGAAFDVITSRATARLSLLFEWATPLMRGGSFCLFHKGENWVTEINEAKLHWSFDVENLPSLSSATGCIIKATNLSRISGKCAGANEGRI